MGTWLQSLQMAWQSMSPWEMAAVVFAITYLLLAVRENILCWFFAFISTAIYTVLFRDVSLLMESALNVYYMAMAVYGWWHWRHGGARDTPLPVRRWPLSRHAAAVIAIVLAAAASGALLDAHSEAARPYLDALVTWGAVVTTFMVARKVLENWAYWMVINSLAIVLFLDRGMLPTAGLHAAYLMISLFGWRAWRRDARGPDSTTRGAARSG
jgi:nicotinamide mononucleotide transporter